MSAQTAFSCGASTITPIPLLPSTFRISGWTASTIAPTPHMSAQVKEPFEGYIDKECTVSRTSLIRYDRNHYSAPCKTAGKTVTVRAKADQIVIIKNGKQIASHPRNFERGKTVYNPWHYLDILQRKPGALRNGAPFQDWDLPPGIKRVQSHLTRLPGGDRKFVDILFAARLHGTEFGSTPFFWRILARNGYGLNCT